MTNRTKTITVIAAIIFIIFGLILSKFTAPKAKITAPKGQKVIYPTNAPPRLQPL